MLKKLLVFISFAICACHVSAQTVTSKLRGRWKFIKIELPHRTSFNLDSLTTSYRQFFDRQKHEVYHDTITVNDSLYINVLFEKMVNNISRMFIEFKAGSKYTSNSFNKQGDITEKTETGTYTYNPATRVVTTRLDVNKNAVSRFTIILVDKTRLVIRYVNTADAATLTCVKVLE